jgi:hypothetical protein
MTTASDGVLFEYFDENMANPWTVSIKEYVESWEQGTVYGEGPITLREQDPAEEDKSVRKSFEQVTGEGAPETPDKTQETEISSKTTAKMFESQMFESQRVGADDQSLEFANAQSGREELGAPSRYAAMKQRENKKNWQYGIGSAVVIVVMLCLAGYFIMQAYDRTLPPSSRALGDMSRPALR